MAIYCGNGFRNLVIEGDILANVAASLTQLISDFNSRDDEEECAKKNFSREPIHVYIYSKDGDVDIALGLYDLMKSSKTPIHTHTFGSLQYIGSILFLGGSERIMSKHSSISLLPPVKIGYMEEKYTYCSEMVCKICEEILGKNMGIGEITNIFSAEDALKNGICTKII